MAIQILLIALASVALLIFLATAFQEKLIYFPRRYRSFDGADAPAPAVALEYTTAEGRQRSYYVPPRAGSASLPSALWVVFGGNGSLALDWLDMVVRFPDPGAAFLLVEYPGYGFCEGSPSPAAIDDASNAAYRALADRLGTVTGELDVRCSVLGHSLGSAAALQFSAGHPVRRAVLVAPFTSMEDMARKRSIWPMHHLLRHRFDNRTRLREFATRSAPPRVTVIHGDVDMIIPVSMGRELGRMFPAFTVYHEVPGGDHNRILSEQEGLIFSAMQEGD